MTIGSLLYSLGIEYSYSRTYCSTVWMHNIDIGAFGEHCKSFYPMVLSSHISSTLHPPPPPSKSNRLIRRTIVSQKLNICLITVPHRLLPGEALSGPVLPCPCPHTHTVPSPKPPSLARFSPLSKISSSSWAHLVLYRREDVTTTYGCVGFLMAGMRFSPISRGPHLWLYSTVLLVQYPCDASVWRRVEDWWLARPMHKLGTYI